MLKTKKRTRQKNEEKQKPLRPCEFLNFKRKLFDVLQWSQYQRLKLTKISAQILNFWLFQNLQHNKKTIYRWTLIKFIHVIPHEVWKSILFHMLHSALYNKYNIIIIRSIAMFLFFFSSAIGKTSKMRMRYSLALIHFFL